MLNHGTVIIFIRDMDRAVKFYTEILGHKLEYYEKDIWASLDAGDGLKIGLHPGTDSAHAPGTNGGTQISFSVTKPIGDVVQTLRTRGAKITGEVREDGPIKLAFVADPDGNELCLFEMSH